MQKITSANTSVNSKKVPALFRKVRIWEPNTCNLDWGGGKYDTATEYLKTQGVENLIYDPYNRSEEHNFKVMTEVQQRWKMIKGGADTVTCSNVLNVIDDINGVYICISKVYKYLRPDGIAYFSIYEGDQSGIGKVTSRGYQRNMRTGQYGPYIYRWFGLKWERRGNIIICGKSLSALEEGIRRFEG